MRVVAVVPARPVQVEQVRRDAVEQEYKPQVDVVTEQCGLYKAPCVFEAMNPSHKV